MRRRKRWYIREVDLMGRTALYGPFPEADVNERLNDDYGKLLDAEGARVDVIVRSDKQMQGHVVNSSEKWYAAANHVRLMTSLAEEEDLPDGPVDSER